MWYTCQHNIRDYSNERSSHAEMIKRNKKNKTETPIRCFGVEPPSRNLILKWMRHVGVSNKPCLLGTEIDGCIGLESSLEDSI